MVVIFTLNKRSGSNSLSKVDETLLERIKRDFPEFNFCEGKKFVFKPPKTIILGPEEPSYNLLMLHELAHAVLRHRNFKMNVERLKMENEAWEKTRELAQRYGVDFDEEIAQEELDTYRDWLHKKSRCPECGLTRFETPDGQYHCPRCENLT